MANRILIQSDPAKIAISKPGFDVTNPSLADANKIFDSDWLFSGQIIMCKRVTWTPTPSTDFDVMYPKALNYYPHVMIYTFSDLSSPSRVRINDGSAFGFWGPVGGHPGNPYNVQALTDRVRIQWTYTGSLPTQRWLFIVLGAA